MNLKKLRLSILLDVLYILIVFVGFALVVTSCKSLGKTTNKTVTKTHTETLSSDTTYQDKHIALPFKGDSSDVVGKDIEVLLRDSVVIRDSVSLRDSIVYEYRIVDLERFKVNHPPVYAFTKYGFAKGWINNNDLMVNMTVHDHIITAEIDSAVQIITNTKTITNTTDEVTETVEVKVPFYLRLHNMIFMAIVLIVLVLAIKYGRKLLL